MSRMTRCGGTTGGDEGAGWLPHCWCCAFHVFCSRVLDTRWQELSGKTSIHDTKLCLIRPRPHDLNAVRRLMVIVANVSLPRR